MMAMTNTLNSLNVTSSLISSFRISYFLFFSFSLIILELYVSCNSCILESVEALFSSSDKGKTRTPDYPNNNERISVAHNK